MDDILLSLGQVLKERRYSSIKNSYVSQLHQKGLNKVLEKVSEETTETILSAKDAAITGDKSDLICETADLWFHSMIMLSHFDVDIQSVLNELIARFGVSGIYEKASRTDEVLVNK